MAAACSIGNSGIPVGDKSGAAMKRGILISAVIRANVVAIAGNIASIGSAAGRREGIVRRSSATATRGASIGYEILIADALQTLSAIDVSGIGSSLQGPQQVLSHVGGGEDTNTGIGRDLGIDGEIGIGQGFEIAGRRTIQMVFQLKSVGRTLDGCNLRRLGVAAATRGGSAASSPLPSPNKVCSQISARRAIARSTKINVDFIGVLDVISASSRLFNRGGSGK